MTATMQSDDTGRGVSAALAPSQALMRSKDSIFWSPTPTTGRFSARRTPAGWPIPVHFEPACIYAQAGRTGPAVRPGEATATPRWWAEFPTCACCASSLTGRGLPLRQPSRDCRRSPARVVGGVDVACGGSLMAAPSGGVGRPSGAAAAPTHAATTREVIFDESLDGG